MADNVRKEHVEKKSKTLFVRNLPFSTTNDKLESLFSEVGPTRSCFVVKEKDSQKCKGYGYVTYSMFEDAEAAVSRIMSLDGRRLFVSYANKKKKEKRKPRAKTEENQEKESDKDSDDEETVQKPQFEDTDMQKTHDQHQSWQELKYLRAKTLVIQGWSQEHAQTDVEDILAKLNVKNIAKVKFSVPDRDPPCAFVRFKSIRDTNRALRKIDGKEGKGCTLKACQLSKETTPSIPSKPQKTVKKARLIIRNLSFKCSEEKLRETFEKFGEVTEVQIPKLKNGKHQGFGIVQFDKTEDASKALKEMNAKPILNRPVAVDWTIPKDKFEAKMNNLPEKENPNKQEVNKDREDKQRSKGLTIGSNNRKETVEKDEESSEDSGEDNEIENTGDSEEETGESDQEEESEEENEDKYEEDSDDEVDSDEDVNDSDDDDDESETSEDDDDTPVKKKGKVNRKSDVGEGRTLFIRNVPFEADEDSLEDVFSEYGKINYVKIVMNHQTGQPKGTAFVQFKTKGDAERFREAAEDEEEGIIVDGRRLNVIVAVEREKAQDLSGQKSKVKEDKRNLHLVREGMIRPGTQAAIGLSKEDLLKRTKLENVKRAKLKNPNIFVSTTRLSIHNIPTQVSEKQLKNVFLRAADSKAAVITECRIMRDLERMNSKKIGKSRGYAFVNFTCHQHALNALRNTNNNADLFGENKRLIVEFSLENKAALQAKEKRMERQKGRLEALKKAKSKDSLNETTEEKKSKKNQKVQTPKMVDKFIGSLPAAEDGKKLPKGLPSHWGAKVRHKPRPVVTTTNKKSKKNVLKRKPEEANVFSEKVKTVKPKKRKTDGVDDFDMLVNKYKKNLLGKSQKSKWFDR
ncbi:RNA-binding protein 28-like [Saccostrea echinata]|uniref:RNA-binding protein 28-like n=1 Tax=Saccostrea echinata TaxID=191078 RepID=UPI002A7F968A|nr:RNA-binding protein 28-like [Saccostrea echinata]